MFDFVVCKIRRAFKKTNTFFELNSESYQRNNVSILNISTLAIIRIEIVNRNENQKSKYRIDLFRKRAEQKQFVVDYCLIGKDGEEIKNC